MTKIVERIAALRQVMEREGLGAFIFPSTDAHNSEYVADHWKGREWISGFNGSAGTVVVTMDAAALWTDSRYFLAAEEQLRGTGIMLMKLKVEGTPTITDWLAEQLRGTSHPVVGLDGWVNGTDEVQRMQAFFQRYGIQMRTDFDPLNEIWTSPPSRQRRWSSIPWSLLARRRRANSPASVSRCAVVMPRPCSSQPSTILPGL